MEINGKREQYGIEVIPAMDIIGGKCVRLEQGDYSRCTCYGEPPLEVARRFEEAGFRRLHMVDLDGARQGKVKHLKLLREVADKTGLAIDFSGGVRSAADIREVLDSGATWACVGSMACNDPELTMAWLENFGYDRLIVCMDVWKEKVCIQGWKEITRTSLYDLIDRYEGKLRHLICTSIVCDGMLTGADLELYRGLTQRYPGLHVIASGGVASEEDVRGLASLGLQGVIVGKALREGGGRLKVVGGRW